jgi:hypothetical protein
VRACVLLLEVFTSGFVPQLPTTSGSGSRLSFTLQGMYTEREAVRIHESDPDCSEPSTSELTSVPCISAPNLGNLPILMLYWEVVTFQRLTYEDAALMPRLNMKERQAFTAGRTSGGIREKPTRLYGPNSCASSTMSEGSASLTPWSDASTPWPCTGCVSAVEGRASERAAWGAGETASRRTVRRATTKRFKEMTTGDQNLPRHDESARAPRES